MDNVIMNEPVNGVAMMKPGQSPSPSPSPSPTPIASPVLMGAQSKNATDSAPVEPISNTHTKTGELEDGLPDTLNVAELAGHVSKLPVARRMTSKGQLGRLSKGVTPSAISKLRTTGPCPGYKAEQLNSKQTRFLILLTMQVYRHQFGQKCVEAHRPEDLIEVWLINRWLKARHPKSPSIIGPEMLEIGSRAMGISGLETPSVLSGEDALIAALSVKVTKTGFDKTLRAMIAQGWVRDMYQDICEDNEHADRAASAVFAIASMVNCRWPLELVHQKSPEMHWKHYRSMETRELAKDGWPIIRTEFTPSSLKLASPGSEAIFNLIALRPLLDFAGEGLSALGDDLSTVDSETKDHSIEEVRSGFSLMTRSAEILESVSSIFQDRLTTMAAVTVNEALADLIGHPFVGLGVALGGQSIFEAFHAGFQLQVAGRQVFILGYRLLKQLRDLVLRLMPGIFGGLLTLNATVVGLPRFDLLISKSPRFLSPESHLDVGRCQFRVHVLQAIVAPGDFLSIAEGILGRQLRNVIADAIPCFHQLYEHRLFARDPVAGFRSCGHQIAFPTRNGSAEIVSQVRDRFLCGLDVLDGLVIVPIELSEGVAKSTVESFSGADEVRQRFIHGYRGHSR